MEFKSQICTTREQSERLLALGIRKETADMALVENWDWNEEDGKFFTGEYFERPIDYVEGLRDKWIPAWSLYRLIELAEVSVEISGLWIKISGAYRYEEKDNVYDNLIDAIKELIDNDVFNKDYLEEKL